MFGQRKSLYLRKISTSKSSYNLVTVREFPTDFSNETDDTFLTGDLNKDHRADVVCHHKQGGISYAYFMEDGFDVVCNLPTEWCTTLHKRGGYPGFSALYNLWNLRFYGVFPDG